MARYLFVWELGGDYGHLARMLPIALALRARGHEVLFALRDLMGAEKLLTPHGIVAYQAPLWLRKLGNLPPADSYPELLMRFGFLNATALTGICRAWRNLVSLIAPDAMVFDHAPTALLATRGLPIRRINLGDGFCIPPAMRPMPGFRWWEPENPGRWLESEQLGLTTANQVLTELGAPTLGAMGELRNCDDTLLCSFAELDHYPRRGVQDYLGPIFSLGQTGNRDWPEGEGPRIFAYLKPDYAGLDHILTALHNAKARVLVHIPGAAHQTLQRFGTGSMVVSAEPLNLAQLRHSCDLGLCHGGAGTTAALLLAGKPLMLFPMQMEQAMAARRLVEMGAVMVLEQAAAEQLPRLLAMALGNAAMADAAQSFARRHANYEPAMAIETAAKRCEAALAPAAQAAA